MAKPKQPRYTQADYRRHFGEEVGMYNVVESALHPGEIQINQYASRLIGPLTPTQARQLAAGLIAGADTIEAEAAKATQHGGTWESEEDLPDELSMDPKACDKCGGPMTFLGTLGRTNHYRCRNCGADHHDE